MGLFSSKKSVTNITEVFDTENISIADLEDSVALAGVRDSTISIVQTDQGALEVAGDIASEGFDFIGAAFSENVKLTRDVLDFQDAANERVAITLAAGQSEALGFGADALDFADRSQVEAFAFGTDALQLTAQVSADSIDFAGELASSFSELAGGQSTQLLSAIDRIQARESTNTDARLGDITKVALIVAGGVAFVAIAVPVFRKR